MCVVCVEECVCEWCVCADLELKTIKAEPRKAIQVDLMITSIS